MYHINMSIDPYTGKTPSYCFVELVTKEQADRAMLKLNGKQFLGRPVKVGPGVARSKNKRPREAAFPQYTGYRSACVRSLDAEKDTLSKVGDYSLEDCLACQTTIRLTPMSASFSRDTACAYCPFRLKFLRATDNFEETLSVRSSSHEHPLLVIQALVTIAILSTIFLPPRRRIVPRKQRMAGRLGASKWDSSLQIFLTLKNLGKQRRGTKSSWRSLGKCATSSSLQPIERHANNLG